MPGDMAKRTFRCQTTVESKPCYPDHEQFDSGRRTFLWRLGAALIGAGAVSSGILSTGCGDRAVGDDPEPDGDLGGTQGVAPPMDSRIDQSPDLPHRSEGVAPRMDARIDQQLPPEPDMITGGVPRQPDAGIDGITPVHPDAGVPLPKLDH
jgi:hypothetical protein